MRDDLVYDSDRVVVVVKTDFLTTFFSVEEGHMILFFKQLLQSQTVAVLGQTYVKDPFFPKLHHLPFGNETGNSSLKKYKIILLSLDTGRCRCNDLPRSIMAEDEFEMMVSVDGLSLLGRQEQLARLLPALQTSRCLLL